MLLSPQKGFTSIQLYAPRMYGWMKNVNFDECRDIVTDHDKKYEKCELFDEENACDLLEALHEVKNFRRYGLIAIPVVLSIFAVFTNAIFMVFIIRGWKNDMIGSKQKYVFLLNRTIANLVSLLLFYASVIKWKLGGGFDYKSTTLFIFLAFLNFFTLTGTYIGMTFILYCAVKHPIKYRIWVSVSHCIIAVCVIWVLSVFPSVITGLLGATLFYPETAPINCDFHECQQPFAVVLISVLSVTYMTVIIFYLIMLQQMRQRRTKITTERNASWLSVSSERTMYKLAFNLITFAVGSLPILFVCIVATARLEIITILGYGPRGSCKTFTNADLFLKTKFTVTFNGSVSSTIMDYQRIGVVCNQKAPGIIKIEIRCPQCRLKVESGSSSQMTLKR
ncbi:hypothetical protein AB6A40_001736 [Gnathostoma spinigerum]|uniref:G-protein coupled receptors family 1 profile domain-containing protein n=1 Tax=Gnathostoma spinigerum TaxID=75299 RepID=A0ABD6E6Z7_9BILA